MSSTINAYIDDQRVPTVELNPPVSLFVGGERVSNIHKITHHIGVGNRGYVAHWKDCAGVGHEGEINVRCLPYSVVDAIAQMQNQIFRNDH